MWLIAGYDIAIGPQISRSVGGLITCTCPHRCPALLPRSRNQRPPGHGSIFRESNLPLGICPSGPSSSSTASKVTSRGAAILISLRMSKVSTGSRSLVWVIMALLSWKMLVLLYIPIWEYVKATGSGKQFHVASLQSEERTHLDRAARTVWEFAGRWAMSVTLS